MQSSKAAGRTSDRSKIALLDNIKALLIVLVVFGLMMHPVHNDNPVLSGCFDIINMNICRCSSWFQGVSQRALIAMAASASTASSCFRLGVVFQAALLLVNGTTLTPIKLLRFSSVARCPIAIGRWSAATRFYPGSAPNRASPSPLALAFPSGSSSSNRASSR